MKKKTRPKNITPYFLVYAPSGLLYANTLSHTEGEAKEKWAKSTVSSWEWSWWAEAGFTIHSVSVSKIAVPAKKP